MVESVAIAASLAEVWDRHFDAADWPAWVDGFGDVVSSEGYPREGGVLRWRSTPAGRGEVREQVLAHVPRRLHRITFSDPRSEGELETTFEVEDDGTRVRQRLRYGLRSGGPFAALTDLLFIRAQQRGSMGRSLLDLKRLVELAR